MQAMCRYSWPGNVRELNNVLERAILLCDDTEITLDDLPESISGTVAASRGFATTKPGYAQATPDAGLAPDSAQRLRLPEQWLDKPLHEVREAFVSDLERQYVEELLLATGGRIGEAAKRAGLRERSLYEKMKQLGLRKEDFRRSRGDEA
jgi:DNA-binding NtrC family response regulator